MNSTNGDMTIGEIEEGQGEMRPRSLSAGARALQALANHQVQDSQPKKNRKKLLKSKANNSFRDTIGVDRGQHADHTLLALKKLKPDGDYTEEDLEHVLREQYPKFSHPTPQDMDYSLLDKSPNENLLFGAGQWVEYRGMDQNWHLARVLRIQARAPLEYRPDSGVKPNWEYSYNLGRGLNVAPNFVRAPQEALKRQFGLRPFLFLQWALLRFEQTVQFQDRHSRDFELMNFQYFAEKLWEDWLNHPLNKDFKNHFESFDTSSRKKLLQSLLSSFAGMDRLSKLNQPGSRWDFKNQNISIYTYPSLLGSGWTTCILILSLQIFIPVLLFLGAMDQSERFLTNTFISIDPLLFCNDPNWLNIGNYDIQRIEALCMNILVILLYSFRVAPRVFDVFYETIAEGWTPASRLNALRKAVWMKGNDTDRWSMLFAYRLERFIKAVYMSSVSILMLFVLFLSDSVLDIILNCLAIEFIWEIDIEQAKSPYFDPKRRFIKAGAVECRLRSTLDLHALRDPRLLCKEYDIPLESYKAQFDGILEEINDLQQAKEDEKDEQFMTETDMVWNWASEIAVKEKLNDAIWQFTANPLTQFGWFDRFRISIGLSDTGIFRRFTSLRTWSRWEKILFLPRIPGTRSAHYIPTSLNEIKKMDVDFHREMVDLSEKDHYVNFRPEFLIYTAYERFILQIIDVLTFTSLFRAMKHTIKAQHFLFLPIRLLDELLQYFSFLVQILFPFVMVGLAVLKLGLLLKQTKKIPKLLLGNDND